MQSIILTPEQLASVSGINITPSNAIETLLNLRESRKTLASVLGSVDNKINEIETFVAGVLNGSVIESKPAVPAQTAGAKRAKRAYSLIEDKDSALFAEQFGYKASVVHQRMSERIPDYAKLVKSAKQLMEIYSSDPFNFLEERADGKTVTASKSLSKKLTKSVRGATPEIRRAALEEREQLLLKVSKYIKIWKRRIGHPYPSGTALHSDIGFVMPTDEDIIAICTAARKRNLESLGGLADADSATKTSVISNAK